MPNNPSKPQIPDSYEKGELFEKYVRSVIFPKSLYTVIEKTHNYEANYEDFIESSRNPDYKLRDISCEKEFYLEAKYRTKTFDKTLEWCRYDQLKRYASFENALPVFIIIGLGGNPSEPKSLHLFPLKKAMHTDLFQSTLEKFKIPTAQLVEPLALWNCYHQWD